MLKRNFIVLLMFSYLFIPATSFAENNQTKPKKPNTDPVSKELGFSIREEKEIGFQTALIMAKRYGLYSDNEVLDYINTVGQDVVKKNSKRPDIDYKFYILDTMEINAFATPGGYIFITKGALKAMKTENELAAVIAHEIGHIESGHGLAAVKSDPEALEKMRVMKVEFDRDLAKFVGKKKSSHPSIVNSGTLQQIQNKLQFNDGSIKVNDK